jgi:5-methylcytosine-specific restriction enzyme subunit McrC
MNRVLTLLEHGMLPVDGVGGITTAQLDHLCRMQKRLGTQVVSEVRRDGQWMIKASSLVGTVFLHGGDVLEILPKTDHHATDGEVRTNLAHMIARSGVIPALEDGFGPLASDRDLISAFLLHLAGRIFRLVHKGLPREYVRRTLMSGYIKGRLNIRLQVTKRTNRYDSHHLVCDELTHDNYNNRLLKSCLPAITMASRSDRARNMFRSLAVLMQGIGEMPVEDRAFDRLHFDRRNDAWQPVFELLRLFVRDLFPSPRAGNLSQGPAWLFDMNTLFEAYVGAVMRRLHGSRVILQGPSRFFLFCMDSNQNWQSMKPDITLMEGRNPSIILDTKWKILGDDIRKDVSSADLRQIFTYARIYGAGAGVLVYPSVTENPRHVRLRTNESSPIPVHVLEIPVSKGRINEMAALLRLEHILSIGCAA